LLWRYGQAKLHQPTVEERMAILDREGGTDAVVQFECAGPNSGAEVPPVVST
jgi:hypothetical protein